MTFVSFVIPAKNEFPQVVWTIYSIIEHIPKEYDYEVILVNDASTDKTSTFWGDKTGWRGLPKHGKLKIIDVSPDNMTIGNITGVGCWRARTLGFNQAKGDIIIFSDAHIAVCGDTIERIIRLLENEEINLLHTPISVIGDDPRNPYKVYGYRLRLQNNFWGSFTNRKLRDTPYTIAMGGFAFTAGKREWLEKLGL